MAKGVNGTAGPSARKRATTRPEEGSDASDRERKKAKTDVSCARRGGDVVDALTSGVWFTDDHSQRQREREPQNVKSHGTRANALAGAPPAFKPRPIGVNGPSDADDGPPLDLPPPPSEKRIARRRESTRAKLAHAVASPAPTRAARDLAAAAGDSDSDNDSGATRAQSLFTPRAPKPVAHLNFRPITRPRPSAAPPPSPGAFMAPPPSVPRRAARKSRLGGAIMEGTIPLPIADTPVINKNRELRRDGERRSSIGLRGQRASSSFERGEPSYPHSSVSPSQFYKHIPPDLPEPVKARWLIAWCARRTMDEHTSKSKARQRAAPPDEVDKLLGDVVDDFVASVAKGNLDTNIFPTDVSRLVAPELQLTSQGASTSAMPVRPHPRNVDNRATLEKEQAIIRRMKAEDRDWSRIAANANAQQAAVVSELSVKARTHAPPDMSTAPEWLQRALRVADDVLAGGDKDIGSAGNFGQVEFEVDMLHQTSHQAHQYALQAQRFLDGIFSSLASDLRARDGETRVPPPTDDAGADAEAAVLLSAAAGPSRPRTDPINMLRALASADAKKQTPETVAKAAAVAAVSATPRAPALTPRRAGPGATPRRAGVYGRAGTPGKR